MFSPNVPAWPYFGTKVVFGAVLAVFGGGHLPASRAVFDHLPNKPPERLPGRFWWSSKGLVYGRGTFAILRPSRPLERGVC